jgi:hypothetical protein
LLKDIDRELNALEQSTAAQDPQELKGRRTFGKGGPRRLTAAEIAEKELAKSDRNATSKRSANLEIMDLTGPQRISTIQPRSTPFTMTFSATGNVVQSPGASSRFLPFQGLNSADISPIKFPIESAQVEHPPITAISTTVRPNTSAIVPITDPKIIVMETWTTEESEASINTPRNNTIPYRNPPLSPPVSAIELPPQLSPSRPRRSPKRRSIYDGELVQPSKRHRRRN